MSDDLSADGSSLGRKAHDALRAYWRQTPSWRSLLFEVLEEWAAKVKDGDLPEAQPLAFMLNIMADALRDAAAGVPHPFLAIPPMGTGSPRANSAQRARRRAIATLAAFKLAAKDKGMTNRKCFEEAADAVRESGGRITWSEIQTAWQNRHSYSADDRRAIEAVRQMRKGQCTAIGAHLYVEQVAFYTTSPAAREARGGKRR